MASLHFHFGMVHRARPPPIRLHLLPALPKLQILGAYEVELDVLHVYWPWTPQRDRAVVLRRIADRSLAVDHMISRRVPYTLAPAVYERIADGGEGWLGIILTWSW